MWAILRSKRGYNQTSVTKKNRNRRKKKLKNIAIRSSATPFTESFTIPFVNNKSVLSREVIGSTSLSEHADLCCSGIHVFSEATGREHSCKPASFLVYRALPSSQQPFPRLKTSGHFRQRKRISSSRGLQRTQRQDIPTRVHQSGECKNL